MKKLYQPTAIALLLAAMPLLAMAGGWPVKKGKFMLSASASYFRATQLWDSTGALQKYKNGGYFASKSFSLYAEYGISRKFTAVASLPYVINEFSQPGTGTFTTQGLTDAEFGVRYYLANINFKYYFAIQGLAIAPLYSNTALGFSAPGGEVRLIGSGSGSIGSKHFYFNAEVGGRQYLQNGGPFQLRYTGSFGVNFTKHHQVTVGASGTYSTSVFKGFNPNIVLNKDFSYTQGTLGYAYIVNPNLSFAVAANQFLTGYSTGKGTAFSFSVITRF